MKGFLRFLGKESMEAVRTWRIWVLPGLLVFFAATSPILAKATPALLESAMQGQQGMSITIPEPTYVDAYAQWLKNLQQIVMFALILTSGGMIAGERSSGTAILVLTKPVSRGAFVIAKFVSQAVLLVLFTTLGTLVCWGATYATFGEAPAERLLGSTGAWLAFALLMLAAMTLFSAGMKSLAAGGAGLATFFVVSVAALWGPALRYSPAGISAAAASVLAGEDVALVWPGVTTALAALVLIAAAVWVFRRTEP